MIKRSSCAVVARGFTMIELLITLLIIAIIAGISMGALVDTGSRSPRQVMTDIKQLLALAQDEASITGTIKGLFVEAENQLELRDFTRESKQYDNVAGAFGDLISNIANVNTAADENGADGFTTLEDRGAFPPITEANWGKLIYSLQLPQEYQLQSQLVAAIGQSGRSFTTDRNDILPAGPQPEDEAENGEEEAGAAQTHEPLVRFFPDGSVQPGGSFVIFDDEQKIQLSWDTSGHITLID